MVRIWNNWRTKWRADDESLAEERNRLHDLILAELERTNDPFRSMMWSQRPWRHLEPKAHFHGLETRPGLERPVGFPWDPNNPWGDPDC